MRIFPSLTKLIAAIAIVASACSPASAQRTYATIAPEHGTVPGINSHPSATRPTGVDSKLTVTHGQIIAVQTALAINGCYEGSRNGRWNPATQRAAERVLAAQGISLDATQPTSLIVSLLLRPDIGNCGGTAAVARAASEGAVQPNEIGKWEADPGQVVALQAALLANQCYFGEIDGRWGNKSRRALRAFERHASLGTLVLSHALDAITARPQVRCTPPRSSTTKQRMNKQRSTKKRAVRRTRNRSATLPGTPRRKQAAPKMRRKRWSKRPTKLVQKRKKRATSRDCASKNAPGSRSMEDFIKEVKCRRSRR